MNMIITVLECTIFWLICLELLCAIASSEWVPVIKAFRVEQAKYPRFTDIEGHKAAKIILGVTVSGMFLIPVIILIVGMIIAGVFSTVLAVLSMFLGFVLLMVGLNHALWGSALRKYRALPDGLIIAAVGAVLFILPSLVSKLCS